MCADLQAGCQSSKPLLECCIYQADAVFESAMDLIFRTLFLEHHPQ